MMEKTYLGDGVYLAPDPDVPGDLILTTEDGYRATNRIVLDPAVQWSLWTALTRIVANPRPVPDAPADEAP